ncbi:hypothetical protein M0802_012891 [Mischocyttarus mexicanus]|nr:hypothetical protein M0802_012891 [Mischocyttarus mexicanus]
MKEKEKEEDEVEDMVVVVVVVVKVEVKVDMVERVPLTASGFSRRASCEHKIQIFKTPPLIQKKITALRSVPFRTIHSNSHSHSRSGPRAFSTRIVSTLVFLIRMTTRDEEGPGKMRMRRRGGG